LSLRIALHLQRKATVQVTSSENKTGENPDDLLGKTLIRGESMEECDAPAEPKLIGNREIGKSAGRETLRIASSNEFDYPPKVGG